MSKIKTPIIIAISVIVIALLALGAYWQFFRNKSEVETARASEYQAVFLTSGQVYFGKVKNQNHQFVTLSDIYYLKVSDNLQPPASGETGTDINTNQTNQQSGLSLIKLGHELHGPVDQMEINRDQILFIEDLRPDSRVVEAIKDYQDRLTD